MYVSIALVCVLCVCVGQLVAMYLSCGLSFISQDLVLTPSEVELKNNINCQTILYLLTGYETDRRTAI